MVRGSAIECIGSADLVRREASGRKRWLMQADEVLYLHPDRVRLEGPAIDVDIDPLPDVVLEVDHTTDVRRRKLGIYKASGFPEVWVLVPWDSSVREPGLVIHVRRGAGYGEEGESRAFPGWKAQEIHRALTEAPMSQAAWRALERTARAMGAREGTTPQDHPLMASESARVQVPRLRCCRVCDMDMADSCSHGVLRPYRAPATPASAAPEAFLGIRRNGRMTCWGTAGRIALETLDTTLENMALTSPKRCA